MNTSGKQLWIIAVLGCLWPLIGPATAWAQAPAPLPFWLSYCADLTCNGLQPLVVHICPKANPSCKPSRQTTVVPQVDGRQINQILFPVQTPDGFTGTYVSGSGSVFGSLVVSYTSPVIVKSDVDVTLSYYKVAPVWGGTTSLNFVSSIMSSPEVVTTVYRYPAFLVNDEAVHLHERGRNIILQESQIARINPGQMHAFFLPSEFSTLGEGNFSDPTFNIITINYGNPDYIAALGSIYATALPRFAHEYVHELFSEVSQSYPGNNSCLNEGLADAFAFAAGFLPEPDFGPIGQHGTDFDQGCTDIAGSFEIHDAGNCPFWQVRLLGLLSQGFVGQMLHPQHVIEFDSCNLTSARTGNALVVLFSEAAGRDMTLAIEMARIPNAGSFEAANHALGATTPVHDCKGKLTTIPGGITLHSGDNCTLVGAHVSGGVKMDGGTLKACNSFISGGVHVTGGLSVSLGLGPEDSDSCPGNRITGGVKIQNVTGFGPDGASVELEGSSIVGGVRLENNGRVELENNTIDGGLHCSGNVAVTNDGRPNIIAGGRVGQCAGL